MYNYNRAAFYTYMYDVFLANSQICCGDDKRITACGHSE